MSFCRGMKEEKVMNEKEERGDGPSQVKRPHVKRKRKREREREREKERKKERKRERLRKRKKIVNIFHP